MARSHVLAALALALVAAVDAQVKCPVTLKNWAYLPAKTFVSPPKQAPDFFAVEGRFDHGSNFRVEAIETQKNCMAGNAELCTDQNSPWKGQAVQGFSGIRTIDSKHFWVLTDNGLGNKRNSPDAMLMIHEVESDWAKKAMKRVKTIFFSDPDKNVPWVIRNENTKQRYLTGADFDVESFQWVNDRLWVGDEFGPFLIEFSSTGEVRNLFNIPYKNYTLRSPDNEALTLQNPGATQPMPTIRRSKGFEGMAKVGTMLYPLLEGPVVDPYTGVETKDGREYLRIFAFDTVSKAFKTDGQWPAKYLLEANGNAIGDFNCVDERYCMIIERDNGEGEPSLKCAPGFVNATCFASPAAFKRVYLIDLKTIDADGFVKKVAYIDLLDIKDPNAVSPRSRGGMLTFPFVTIEDVDVFNAKDNTIVVANDNNFPYSMARTLGKADDNEFVILHAPAFFNGGSC